MTTELIATPFYCFTLLLKVTLLSFFYRVTLLIHYSFWVLAFYPVKNYLNNDTAPCKVIRHRMARLIGLLGVKLLSLVLA